MDLLDKLRRIASRVEAYGAGQTVPGATVVDAVNSPTEVVMNGRRTLMFGSNNYFGLTSHPEVVEAARAAVATYGAATTGSRIANGTYAIHEDLERRLALTFGMRESVVFTTGYQANLAVIGALCGPADTILLDAESHASVCDGARLSGASVIWVEHNDPGNLAKKLDRIEGSDRTRLVVVEGLYSIRGDVGRLEEIVAVSHDRHAYVLVDEAHSFGIYGAQGLGAAEAQGVLDKVDFITGTFSKALGGVGGFCVSNHPELRMLTLSARAYMFTASSAPASVAAATAALAILQRDRTLRDRLWSNVHSFREGLKGMGYRTSDTDSPLIPVFIGDERLTVALWEALLHAGVYVNIVISPACRTDECLLRTSCSSVHTPAQITEALDAFAAAGRRLGIIPGISETAGMSSSGARRAEPPPC